MSEIDKQQIADYYKHLYEKEVEKNEELTKLLVDTEAEAAEANRKLDTLKSSKLFKVVKPFRTVYAKSLAAIVRVKNLGSVKGVVDKLKQKRIEKGACKYHGTLSFPNEEERKAQESTSFNKKPLFSILVPLFNTPEVFLREMIESCLTQTYGNWQLCLADGSDAEHAQVGKIVQEYIDREKAQGSDRITYKKIEKNLGISGNTNVCFELAKGDYIALFDHDDLLHPSVLFEYVKIINEQDADFIYCDEATFTGDSVNNMVTLHFKPDYSPDNLLANNYICHFSAFKTSLLKTTGLFRSEYDGSQDHDMILRLTAAAENIVHVPKILYYWRSHAASVAADINAKTYAIDAAKRAVLSGLEARGITGAEVESTRAFATIFRIRYVLKAKPKISIIIPNKDHLKDLKRCIESITVKSTYPDYEIIVVENNSETEEIFAYYKELEKTCPFVKIVKYEGSFNYSRICNFGVQASSGEYILLLNNDTEVITRNFLEELLAYAQRDDVGAVGAKLYYENYTIQHAGIVIGLGAHRTAGHTHYGLAKDNLGYMGRLCYAQNVSAVTGACLMVSRADYDSVGGLEEELAVALNDVDFCLKLRKKGKLNIFTPFAELFHYESISRGSDIKDSESESAKRYAAECEIFKQRWKCELEKGDPYYNPNFSLDHSNYTLKAFPMPQVR